MVDEQNGEPDGEKSIDFSMSYKPVIVNQVRYNAIIFMKVSKSVAAPYKR